MRSRAGHSVVELLTAVSIFGVLAAVGLPHIDTHRQDLQNAVAQVVGDFRWARARAITSGAHFALEWTGSGQYRIARMKATDDGTWEVDEVVKEVRLPATVVRWGWPNSIEFNTRGMMVSSTDGAWQHLWDVGFGAGRQVTVWPSGQTNEAN
jgi:Tfp pilus assembly protein FimT